MVLGAVFVTGLWGQEMDGKKRSLADLSIEELMNEPVTSVSKRETRLSDAPAAVYVVTQEDIRRSGANNIAEALRMVPGLEVARVDANKWAISSRGFNGLYANKLLVLMDGRSVYTPLYAGVHWDAQDTLLEDIDRIEVIRGPGASLWGANAVNGVINVITRPAKETQGTLITAGGGTEELGFGGVRYGGKVNDETHYRVYAKYSKWDNSAQTGEAEKGEDAWDMFQTGFRLDWDASKESAFTLEGGLQNGRVGGHFPVNQLDFSQSMLDQVEVSRLAALTPRQRAQKLADQARDYLNRGLLLEAERLYQSAVAADGSFAEAHTGLAEVRERTGDSEAARKEARTSLKLQRSADAYLVLSRLDLAASHLDEANKEAGEALRLDPQSREAQELRRQIEARQGAKQ